MSERRQRTQPLGTVDPGRSRHAGRRSAVTVADGPVVATTTGGVRAFTPGLERRWRADGAASLVAAVPFNGAVAVGERGPDGEIRVVGADGVRWRYRTADDVGAPVKPTRFQLPFIASLVADGDRLYAATRRYERREGERHFESAVYAFTPDGRVRWRYRVDASPVSLDADGERVAVAYNRCPGDHDQGLVVLDATTGDPRWTWDPGTAGQRRVGDVSTHRGRVAVASHGDYRGYLLADGDERWRTSLGRPRRVDGELVYTYPNHVHATGEGVLFVTGNTYPEEGRETAARHPGEHTVTSVDGGDPVWTAGVGGFVTALGVDGTTVAVPCAQHFRDRDPDEHGLTVFDVTGGEQHRWETEGVVTAAAVAGARVAAVEEPVVYHDEGVERGEYRLHTFDK
jgi:outer membrane protein assembly factor BamB